MLAAASGSHGAGPVPVIETERLILRAHRVEDYAGCIAIWSDPQVTRFIGGRAFTAEEIWKRLLQYAGLWSLLGFGSWAVEEKASGRYIGDVGFFDLKRDLMPSLDGMLELGWVLAVDAQGKGYASEAVAAACQWGQANGGDRRMVCIIAPENQPSLRVAEKAGFKVWQQGTYHDAPILVLAR
jgi:RimJ/RimL family protein N-acetyltransferase